MKLLTKELKKELPTLDEIDEDPLVYAKYFHPLSNWTWYVCAYDPKRKIFTGLVDGFEVEWGDFSLKEMQEIEVMGLGIERDLHFDKIRLSELKKMIKQSKRRWKMSEIIKKVKNEGGEFVKW